MGDTTESHISKEAKIQLLCDSLIGKANSFMIWQYQFGWHERLYDEQKQIHKVKNE